MSNPFPTDVAAARRLLSELRREARRPLMVAMASGAIAALAVIAQAWLIAELLYATLFRGVPLAEQTLAITLVALAILVRVATTAFSEIVAVRAGFDAAADLRRRLIDAISHKGPISLATVEPGRVVAAIGEAARSVEPFISRYVPASVQALVLPLAILLIVLPRDWQSFLIFVVTAPLIPLFMVLIGKGAESRNQRQWLRMQRLSGHFLDLVQGLATIRAFGAAARAEAAVAENAETYRRDTMSVLKLAFVSSLTLEFFASISIALVAVLIGFRLLWGQIDYGTGLFILLLAPEFYLPLRALGAAYHARMEAIGAADRAAALLALPDLSEPGGKERPDLSQGVAITLDGVTLRYGRKAALGNTSLSVRPGETVALAGPSGAGKSSVLALIAGFARPTSGTVRVNGVPLCDIDGGWWRENIAYAPQRPRIFSSTLAQNVAPGEDVIDRQRLETALAEAGLADLVARLPQGADTPIGEGGRRLSGGEAHRVALARAFYRNAPLVLLDEPTAHLDAEAEAAIHEGIRRLKKGRTIILAAHRPATLALADHVIELAAAEATP